MDVEEKLPPKSGRTRSPKKLIVAAVALVLVAFAAGAVVAQLFSEPGVSIPDKVAQKINFPVYLPRKLPGNFQIAKNSFTFEEGALVFKATDGTGASITFAEQKRKTGFDFTAFHNSELKDTTTLEGVPYPSVVGTGKDGQTKILSVVAEGVWLFISTQAPLSPGNLQVIAASLQQTR